MALRIRFQSVCRSNIVIRVHQNHRLNSFIIQNKKYKETAIENDEEKFGLDWASTYNYFFANAHRSGFEALTDLIIQDELISYSGWQRDWKKCSIEKMTGWEEKLGAQDIMFGPGVNFSQQCWGWKKSEGATSLGNQIFRGGGAYNRYDNASELPFLWGENRKRLNDTCVPKTTGKTLFFNMTQLKNRSYDWVRLGKKLKPGIWLQPFVSFFLKWGFQPKIG